MPAGLYYCRIPSDWAGADHGRAFYLLPPATCDATAGYVLAPVAETLPRLDIYYGYNVAEAEYADSLRPARTPVELARQECRRPRQLSGVTLLGHSAVGCETQKGDWVHVSASTPYGLEADAKASAPDAMLIIGLTTTRNRLVLDRAVFATFAANVYQCAAQWHDDKGKAFWVGAAPGRPHCPPDAFW